jgi:hypothetical protein
VCSCVPYDFTINIHYFPTQHSLIFLAKEAQSFLSEENVTLIDFKVRGLVVVGFSSRRCGFDSWRVNVRCLVEKVTLGKCFLQQIFVLYQHYSTIFVYGNKRAVRQMWRRETSGMRHSRSLRHHLQMTYCLSSQKYWRFQFRIDAVTLVCSYCYWRKLIFT